MSSHEHLSAASNDRKARLAQLKSLKRKQAPDDTTDSSLATSTALTTSTAQDAAPSVTTTYLSGRNFDPSTRNVKLGFENTPIADQTSTLEYKAQQLALATKAEQEQEKSDAPLDLFKLQPKKPNWDLKRDLEEKMRTGGLEIGTENAIARLVRERVENQKRERESKAVGGGARAEGEGQEVGMEGGELVEAMNQREAEEERERRRDEEEDVEG